MGNITSPARTLESWHNFNLSIIAWYYSAGIKHCAEIALDWLIAQFEQSVILIEQSHKY